MFPQFPAALTAAYLAAKRLKKPVPVYRLVGTSTYAIGSTQAKRSKGQWETVAAVIPMK